MHVLIAWCALARRLEDCNRANRTFEALSGSYAENVTDTSEGEPSGSPVGGLRRDSSTYSGWHPASGARSRRKRKAVFGIMAGLLLTAAAARVLGVMLFGVSPLSASTLSAAIVALLVAAFLATAVPAWRAAAIDPDRSHQGGVTAYQPLHAFGISCRF